MRERNEIAKLTALGLTPNEAACYLVLVRGGAATAAGVAKAMKILPNAVYRLLESLQAHQLVAALTTTPKKYQAVPIAAGLSALSTQRIAEIEEAKLQAISALTSTAAEPETKVDFVTGKLQFFETYAQLAAVVKQEILVIAIGDPVPDIITLSNRDAIQRGVDLKILYQRYDHDNYNLVQSSKAMGADVAHYPDSGFHLIVFDQRKAILLATNPHEHSERTGMVITSPGLAGALREFFFTRWERATPVMIGRGPA